MKNNKKFLSTMEVADILNISRVAVFKKIKKGEIPAQKVGRNYIIKKRDLAPVFNDKLTKKQKHFLKRVIDKASREYGEAFKKLSKE